MMLSIIIVSPIDTKILIEKVYWVIPMIHPGHDLQFYIFLYLFPFLSIFWSMIWEKLFEIARCYG